MQGFTQNQNESINHVLWNRCPKTIFCGKYRLILAVSETVCQFNTGSASRALLLKSSGIRPNENMLRALRKSDNERINRAAKRITEKARLHRRKLRAKRKNHGNENDKYLAGSFGLGTQPENLMEKSNNKSQRKKIKIANDENYTPTDVPSISSLGNITVTFVDENDIGLFVTGLLAQNTLNNK